MANTIAQLWNGSLEPIRYLGINNQEIKKLEELMHRNREKFQASLDEKQLELFEKFNDCINEYIISTAEQAFCDGYSLGTKILSEAMTGAEQIT